MGIKEGRKTEVFDIRGGETRGHRKGGQGGQP